MRSGGSASEGSNSLKVESMAGRTLARNSANSVFIFGFERNGTQLPRIVLQKDLHTPFGLFQPRVAESGQLDALLKQLQCRIQRQISRFELLYDFFQPLQRGFEIRSIRHEMDCS